MQQHEDAPEKHTEGQPARAFVHEQSDIRTLNFAGFSPERDWRHGVAKEDGYSEVQVEPGLRKGTRWQHCNTNVQAKNHERQNCLSTTSTLEMG